MKTRTKVLASMLAVGTLGSVAVFGAFGAFTETTTNAGNQVSAGTVTLGDNDAGTALYYMPTAAPGDSVTRCIKVTYAGSLKSTVDLYTNDNNLGTLAQYVDLTITQGTQASSTFPSCTGFTAAIGGGLLYDGTLEDFSTTHTDVASAIDTNPTTVDAGWVSGDSVVYQLQVTLDAAAPVSAEAQTTEPHGYVWEAVNS